MRIRSRQNGFTLIELLASAAIVGLLASIAVPILKTETTRDKERQLRIALREIRQGIDAYKQAVVAGKVLPELGASGYPPTLEVLVEGTEDASHPDRRRIYFLRRIPRDPFYAGAQVTPAKTWGKRSFDSPPEQPRAGDDVFDVYSTSTRIGLNGLAYREW